MQRRSKNISLTYVYLFGDRKDVPAVLLVSPTSPRHFNLGDVGLGSPKS